MSAVVIDLMDYKEFLSFAKWTTENVKDNFLVKTENRD